MGIPKHLTVTVSGLVFGGLVLVMGPATAANVTTPACAGVTTTAFHQTAPEHLQAGCRWNCTKWKKGTCTHRARVCTGGGGGANVNINNTNTNINR